MYMFDSDGDGSGLKEVVVLLILSVGLLAGTLALGSQTGAITPAEDRPATYFGQINHVSHSCSDGLCDVTVTIIYPNDVDTSELEKVQFTSGGLFSETKILYEREVTAEEQQSGQLTVEVTGIEKSANSTAFVVRTEDGDGTAHPYSL